MAVGANALACYAGKGLAVQNWVYEEQAKPLKQEHLIKSPRAFFLSNRSIRFSKNNQHKFLSWCLAGLACGALSQFFRVLLIVNIAINCKLNPLNNRIEHKIKKRDRLADFGK